MPLTGHALIFQFVIYVLVAKRTFVLYTLRPCRKSRSKGRKAQGERTRKAILETAVHIASAEGLEGLTIGRLALELSMSKSGLFAHFGSKEDLQVATVEAARAIFIREVIQTGLRSDPGTAASLETLRHLAGLCAKRRVSRRLLLCRGCGGV